MAKLTIRPNAAGNQQGWDAEGGGYDRVDEVISDGDTTRVYTPTDDRVATFNLDDSTTERGAISGIEVFINTKGVDPISKTVQLAIRTGGTDYFSSDQTYNNTSYHEESNTWSTNPDTSSAWTWEEIDSLEAGMKRISGGGQAVTQVWVVVTYTPATIEQEGFRWRDDDDDEASASWLAAQDSNLTRTYDTNTRLRVLLDSTNSAGSGLFQLEFKEKVAGSYAIVPLTGSSYGDDVTTGGTAGSSGDNPPNEDDSKAFDNDTGTKWLVFSDTGYLTYDLGEGNSATPVKYDLVSANDEETRDPYTWDFQGSNDGSSWDTLDSQTAETFADRFTRNEYTFSNTTAYRYFKLDITANNGAGITQLAELQIFELDPSEISIATSDNIGASGENTTAQLSAPSGKTTGDFDAGRIQDDENPADSVTIGDDNYTEMEWCLTADAIADGNTYQFRVTDNGNVIDTYTVTPEWTIGTAGANTRRYSLTTLGVS